jgi:lipooligosaccharide transport system ATP-binding protein
MTPGILHRVPEVLVRARGLTKRFGSFTAVDGIDFDLYQGEAFGFLGPNGAGKSSTMRMISCVSPPTLGELTILGADPVRNGAAIRARLGVVPQEDTLDLELTVRENLLVYGRYFGLPRSVIAARTDQLLDFVQLTERATDMVEPLSGGMKRRLTIARSLINDPDILILDEPTTGLDPQARHAVWDRLFRLKQRGVTLILTTHYMDEAEQLCDRLVVMDHAKIVAEGTPRELIERYSTQEVLELRFDPALHEQAAEKIKDVIAPGGSGDGGPGGNGGTGSPPIPGGPGSSPRTNRARTEVLADRILLYVADAGDALTRVREAGLEPLTELIRRSTLEDVFLYLTGRQLVD